MPTFSLIYSIMPTDIGSVAAFARLAENTSSNRLWLGQSLNIETHHVFAALTGMGFDIGYGTAVTVMPLRHPLTAAINARSIAGLSGQSFITGIGPGAAALQRNMLGAPYRKPVTATRQYVTMVRTLAEGKIAVEPEGPWAAQGLELPDMDTPPVEIGLGVLREPMAKLAGQVADWAITWLTPHNFIRDRIIPAMAAAAEQAQRPVPRVASVVHCAVDRPHRDLTEIAFHAARNHLGAPHYTDMLQQAGVPVDAAHPRAGADLLVEHGVMVTGTPEDIATKLLAYHEAGTEEIIINLGGVHIAEGPGAALRDLTAIFSALNERGLR
ncbi:LLM class flavin-dependent oxidoreductase [Streptomyces sp. G44]|uniref:LLM class flavin-dependent oxidoreductase n=1 Tax=Streptomyces sp. G44 TaxID=2807632 RepID=UPI001960AA82|nr:LLM class flavin-dependent oxidoreductase [Streptomyces sp. G44]MBM7167706.1 LLM class flavin-dependent oxidoreductase [Streptomyces sp. G44]